MKTRKSMLAIAVASFVICSIAILLFGAAVDIPLLNRIRHFAASIELRLETERVTHSAILKKTVIVCWGDSLTAGMGASFRQDYPAQLSSLLSRPTLNEGIPGDTSTQIRMRMMQRPPGIDEGVTVIWAGRNNYRQNETVVTDIAVMVQSLPQGANYLVLGIINGAFIGEEKGGAEYAQINALNADLQRIYAGRFIPIREKLTEQGNQDDRDIIPADLRADPLHLGDSGYRVVAQLLEAKINSLGW